MASVPGRSGSTLPNDVPIIVKLALGHYQFETLHPYADGNGRLGRLIAILQLIEGGVLASPSLNISPWFEARRDEYMDGLLRVTHTGDFDTWVTFFSDGITAQAKAGVVVIDALLGYKDEMLRSLRAAGLRGAVLRVAENLIGYPVIDVATAKLTSSRT